MTINEFHREFGRLENHFRMEGDKKEITREWFKALSHFHVDALSHAVDKVIQEAQDTFWPALGKITSAIRARIMRYEHTRNTCATCHGNTWIQAQPEKVFGMIYARHQRCPDCGVPPPDYNPNRYGCEPLTALEYQQHISGTFQNPEIYISKSNPLAAQALKAIKPIPAAKPIAQDVDVQDVFISEPGEQG